MIGKELLDYLLLAQPNVILGGDFNCVCPPQDLTQTADHKISNNLVKIIKVKKMIDTYRSLHPRVRSYSHFYSWKGKNGELKSGASRLDRSYIIGNIITKKSSYVTTSFSDHHLHLLEIASDEELINKDRSPSFKPYFKMAPAHFLNHDYRELIKITIREWEAFKPTMEPTEWWDHLKQELKETAKKFEKEYKRNKRARLDLLMMAMEYEAGKVEQGALDHLPELTRVKKEVNNWFEENSRKVIDQGRIRDALDSEKTRIYHHELLFKTVEKDKILKLQLEEEVLEGHGKCAKHLNEEVRTLLGNPAKLNDKAQEELLTGVKVCFTEEDNAMLDSPITNTDIRKSLTKANQKASPGADGIPYSFYLSFWPDIGDHLCDIVRHIYEEGPPTASMSTSHMVFSAKPGKQGSHKPKDKRKLSMLAADYKVLTGVIAARLRKTENHTPSTNFEI